MFQVYLGIGSNLGDRLAYLSGCIRSMRQVISIVSLSSIYETEPVGIEGSTSFFNMVVEAETELLPPELLRKVKLVETSLGRLPGTHMKPREIDIDIELYNAYIYRDETVEVPHPRFTERKFILEPFNELAPGVIHPLLLKTIGTLSRECPDTHAVMRTKYLLTI